MKKIKVGLIGYGNRGRLYFSFIKEMLDKVELVAVCDYRANEISQDIKQTNAKYVFADTDKFFEANLDLDLVLICSMDKYHYLNTKQALEHNYNVLLEKPISANLEEVEQLSDIATSRNLKVIVTYVLRYAPFYEMIKKIIDDGEIGNIININTTENVAYWHQAHSYVRGNWRNSKETGPMILTKCSHDMDLIYWLSGKKVKRISSFGKLSHFVKENAPKGSSEYCTDCKLKDSCPFNCYRFYLSNKEWLRPMVGDELTEKNIIKYLDHGQYSRCVYKCDNDVVDHQIVNIEFEDGTTASHTMNAFTRWCYRDIKVMGEKGCIEGNFEKEIFTVYHFVDNSSRKIDIHDYSDDFTGHGGGDKVMFKEFIEYLLTNKKSVCLTTIQESVISHKMAFAAEKSRLNAGKVVDIE